MEGTTRSSLRQLGHRCETCHTPRKTERLAKLFPPSRKNLPKVTLLLARILFQEPDIEKEIPNGGLHHRHREGRPVLRMLA